MKRHAILVTAYTNPDQLQQLLNLIDHERNDVYLQIDAKSPLVNEQFFMKRSHLFTLPPFKIYWAGYSFIQAELNLLRAASANHYHYYHFITGLDLPLVSQDTIHGFLEHSNLEYIDFAPEYKAFAHFKAAYYHVLVETRFYKKSVLIRAVRHAFAKLQALVGIDRARATGEDFYHGSGYFSITHDLVEYILDHESWIARTFRHGLACDEVFLQTLVMKSPFKDRISGPRHGMTSNLRHIDWTRRDRNSPYTFRMADLDELLEARREAFYARKFNTQVDAGIVDALADRVRREAEAYARYVETRLAG